MRECRWGWVVIYACTWEGVCSLSHSGIVGNFNMKNLTEFDSRDIR